ncbi:negative growth regulatory protein Ngr1p [Monosporozyma unispora]
MDRYIHYLQPVNTSNNTSNNMISSPKSNPDSNHSILSSTSTSSSPRINNHTSNSIPLPPTSTIETSNEPPRTLWMGDLDPNFDDLTIMEIWSHLNKSVIIKLIKAKKNILIPCSTTTNNNNNNNNTTDLSIQNISTSSTEQININGVSFIDPSITPLHHAGYCFVEFQSQNDALFALSLNSKPIPNFKSISTGHWTNPLGTRTFRLNWASGATLTSSISTKPEFSLFVGDLSPMVTEADLLTLFQQKFKSVKTVRVMTDPMTGASRCFGFIRFGNEDERSRALIEMNGVWCQGRALRVAFATPRNSGVSSSNQTSILPKSNPIVSSYYNNNNITSTTTSIPSPQSDIINMMELNNNTHDLQYINNDLQNTTIFIGGLNSNLINEYKLISLFQPFGNILSVKIPLNKNCAFIKFQSKIDAEAAMQGMQGFIIDGQPIRLSWGKNNNTSHNNNNNNNNNNIQLQSNNNDIYYSSLNNNNNNNINTSSMWNDPINNINYSTNNNILRSSNNNQLFQNDYFNNQTYGLNRQDLFQQQQNLQSNNNQFTNDYYHYLNQNYSQQQQNHNTIFH